MADSTTISDSYKVLVQLMMLLNIINPGKLIDEPRLTHRSSTQPEVLAWHRFLVDFGWLGDSQPAGKTVTATAGVLLLGRRTLLVASNNGVSNEVEEHLRFVLRTLQSLDGVGVEGQRQVWEELLNRSLALSYRKILNYRQRLSKLLTGANGGLDNSSVEAKQYLLTQVLCVTEQKCNYLDLCAGAYNFTKTQKNLEALKNLCAAKAESWRYQLIKHYLGRLGSWHRATIQIMKVAIHMPKLLADLTLEVVPQKPVAWYTYLSPDSSLSSLITKLDLGLSPEHVMEKLQKTYDQLCTSNGWEKESLDDKYMRRMSMLKLKPMVHSEVLMADSIFSAGLDYLYNDRYIGCSKPTCVCCQLYLSSHPAQLLPLPCHGNLWHQWSPPALASDELVHYVARSMAGITQELERLLVKKLMGQHSITKRHPDSVTGITKSSGETRRV